MNVIISGASKGLGKAIATAFGALNHNLYLCSRGEIALYQTVESLYQLYPDIVVKAFPADLGKKEGCELFGKFVLDSAGTVDILVNNAGQFVSGSVYNEPIGHLEQMIEANLYSAYHLTRSLIGKMVEQKSGHIFNICSIASIKSYSNGGSYGISKHAMLGFGKNLREEMKPYGIKVTNVIPGAAYTDSWAASDFKPEQMMAPEDVAAMIVATAGLSPRACVEELIMRPQLGDL